MKTETQLLIELVKQNKTLNEISSTLGLSNKQVFTRLTMLRNSGYLIDKNYYHDGEIRYSLYNPFKSTNDKNIYVITPKDISTLRFILTSDTHLGNIYDEIECINNMTKYCIDNGIHLVLNLGDFFNGMYPNHITNRFSSSEEQINYALKNYPYDKNILNFVLLGNHDATFWIENGIDIKTILENRRHDIIPVDYGYGEINIGGCQFRMQHPLQEGYEKSILADPSNKIILKGHSHKCKISFSSNSLSINVPSLSNVKSFSKQDTIPSMIDMEVKINNNKVCSQYLQQFIFINNKPIRVNELQYYVNLDIQNPHYEDESSLSNLIRNAIIESANEVKTYQTNQYQGMSKIEKFNARYNNLDSKTLKK